MKKIFLVLLMAAFTLTASANEVRYFTYQQMTRTVSYLNQQRELMIWCGYPDEIETYCLVNEVWAERVNAQYYEVWLYGYDAWTGEEIYMPIDLGCIWLQGAGMRFYNAATYLRFRSNRAMPTFVWYLPPYHPFERHHHVHGHACTYHHHVHQPGWHHPHPNHNPHHCHPYYMRPPDAPVYYDPTPYHPGQGHPVVSTQRPTNYPSGNNTSQGSSYRSYSRTTGSVTINNERPTGTTTTGNRTGTSTGSNTGNRTSNNSGTSTGTGSGNRGTSTSTPTGNRGTSIGTPTGNRGTSTGTSTGNRGTSTGTSTGNRSTTSGNRSATTPTPSGSRTSNTGTTPSSSTTNRSATSTTPRSSSSNNDSTNGSSSNTNNRPRTSNTSSPRR